MNTHDIPQTNNMSANISDFNSTVVDMISDLATAVPGMTDLNVVANLASGMFKLDPDSTIILDSFYPIITEYSHHLDSQQDETLIQLLKGLLPGQYGESVNLLWDQLSTANKETVWEYINLLKQQADIIKQPSQTEDAQLNSSLFELYNKIWKEYLNKLTKLDKKRRNLWKEANENIENITQADPSALHRIMTEIIDHDKNLIKSTADIMNIIIPKDPAYIKNEIDKDIQGQIGKKPFPLNTDTTFATLLRSTKHHYPELPIYWHYLKVLTTVLAECPPELADLLSSMAETLAPIVQPANHQHHKKVKKEQHEQSHIDDVSDSKQASKECDENNTKLESKSE